MEFLKRNGVDTFKMEKLHHQEVSQADDEGTKETISGCLLIREEGAEEKSALEEEQKTITEMSLMKIKDDGNGSQEQTEVKEASDGGELDNLLIDLDF